MCLSLSGSGLSALLQCCGCSWNKKAFQREFKKGTMHVPATTKQTSETTNRFKVVTVTMGLVTVTVSLIS